MGRVVYSMSVSLDGFVETPSRSLDWVQVDEELHSFFNDEARSMSTFMYGRRMYELMTEYWPTAETDPSATPAMVEFARIWKDKPKIVFSAKTGVSPVAIAGMTDLRRMKRGLQARARRAPRLGCGTCQGVLRG